MTLPVFVIGVDPGRTTGIAIYDPAAPTWDLIQCTPDAVLWIIEHAIDDLGARRIAVERFVVGPRAGRSADAKAGEITRDLIGALGTFQETYGVAVFLRSASEVKPWATNKRLAAAGVNTCSTMRHAADAARQALFAAVRDCGVVDPLSSKVRG